MSLVLALTSITCGSEQMAAESLHSTAQHYLKPPIGWKCSNFHWRRRSWIKARLADVVTYSGFEPVWSISFLSCHIWQCSAGFQLITAPLSLCTLPFPYSCPPIDSRLGSTHCFLGFFFFFPNAWLPCGAPICPLNPPRALSSATLLLHQHCSLSPHVLLQCVVTTWDDVQTCGHCRNINVKMHQCPVKQAFYSFWIDTGMLSVKEGG